MTRLDQVLAVVSTGVVVALALGGLTRLPVTDTPAALSLAVVAAVAAAAILITVLGRRTHTTYW